jgi:hypothetical protein
MPSKLSLYGHKNVAFPAVMAGQITKNHADPLEGWKSSREPYLLLINPPIQAMQPDKLI